MDWFEFGVQAVQRARPGTPECYFCPLCLRGFGREQIAAWLTCEDVPPKSVGGRKIVLTCRECNSTSGHRLDAELRRRETLLDFARGTMKKPTPGVMSVGGMSLRATLMATGENVDIFADVERNPPGAPAAVMEMLERIVADKEVGRSLELHFNERFRARQASIGWLRAAYLAAFTALGYRYILNPALDCVREQIVKPTVSLIKTFSVAVPTASPQERLLALVGEPGEIRSLLVRMGGQMMFLPEPETREMDFYQRIEEGLGKLGGRARFRGTSIPWPTRPAFALDFFGSSKDRGEAGKGSA
jgi:hypothetical protein